MTNKQDEEEASSDSNPHTATLTAVHIISQVLNEAYDIAIAAQDSGQPWRYLSMLKKITNNEIGCVRDEDESFESSKGDSVKENNVEVVANIVATSTPQKNAARQIDCSDELTEFNDSTLIGQGDQGIGENDNTLTNSTSIYINNLFDMRELERVIVCDDGNENIQGTSESNNLPSDEAFSKIMENYVNYLFPSMEDKPAFTSTFNPFFSSILPDENIDENVGESHREQSEYLFLADSSVADIGRDVGFYIEEDGLADRNGVYGSLETDMVQRDKLFECIRHTTTVNEVYEALRTDRADENYENQQTTAFDTENYEELQTVTEEDNVYEGLRSATIEEDLQYVTDKYEDYKGLQDSSVKDTNESRINAPDNKTQNMAIADKNVSECQKNSMHVEISKDLRITDNSEVDKVLQVYSVEEINESQTTTPDNNTQNTAIVVKNVEECHKTTLPVEISKNIRIATIEIYEGLQIASDESEVYEGLLNTAVDVHDSHQTATVEKQIHEDLGSAPLNKENTYDRIRTDEELEQEEDDNEKEAIKQKTDFELYENAYMTLNRDYDQNSEDDGFPILQDPKEMVLQEVELMSHPSEEELRNEKSSVPKQEEASTMSGVSVRSKSTLARRCRLQGARLFACIRGWWRRKTPGKRKEMRKASLGVCPLSPEGRRRSSSLLDSRLLRSPLPSHPALWKFNTVNEALVNSNRWKEYTFDAMVGGSEQF